MKRVFSLVLAMLVFFSNVVIAYPRTIKNESVFINLDYYGNVEQINVYNTYDILGNNEVKDYGEYESISNLTNRTEYRVGEDGEKIWDVTGVNSFSYLGKANNLLYSKVPWTFNVSYKLNGVPIEAKDLLHKYGTVEIEVNVNANENANEYYKNNYMLEITGSFDMDEYLSVESDEAMFISSGNTKTLMFIVLPGQSTDFKLRIGSNDFSMNGLSFAMVPLEGDMLEKISNVAKDKEDFEEALEEINKSTDIVLYAMKNMSSGMSQMKQGMETLKGSTDKLYGLSYKTDEGISSLITSLEDLQDSIEIGKEDIKSVKELVEDVIDMLSELNLHVKKISTSVENIEKDMSDIEEIIEDLPDDLEDLQNTIHILSGITKDMAKLMEAQDSAANIDTDGLNNSLTSIGGATMAIKSQLESPDMATITDPVALAKFNSIGNEVYTIGSELENVQVILTDINDTLGDANLAQTGLISKLKKLANNLDDISNKIDPDDGEVIISTVSDTNKLFNELRGALEITSRYTDDMLEDKDDILKSIDDLQVTLDKINNMITSMNSLLKLSCDMIDILSTDVYVGTNDTVDGLISITNNILNVTNQADQFIYSKDKAKDLAKKQWDKIDDETTLFNVDTNAKVVSFTSDKNEEPNKVQFLLKLPDILENENKIKDLEVNADTGTFFSRLINVFKKMFGWIIDIFRK